MQTEQESTDILDIGPLYVRASAGKRLANYIVDVLVFYLLIFVFGVVLAVLSPESVEGVAEKGSGFGLLERLVILISYAFYMSLAEAIFKGKSLGKLITKTRALNLDGSRITASTAFARGFSRAVPFCVFSAFGNPCNPWQDRWTDTMVVDETQTTNS